MKQLDMFAVPEAKEHPERADERRPITPEEARLLTGGDAIRILCGEPREVALEKARRRLEQACGKKVEPAIEAATVEPAIEPSQMVCYVNMTGEVVSFRTERHLVTCCPDDAVWLRPEEPHGPLVDASTARRMLGNTDPSARLAVALKGAP